MAEDRFANVFTAAVVMTAANALTFIELNFGIGLRDKLAVVIDEVYFTPATTVFAEMTTAGDTFQWGLTMSDQVTNMGDLGDRRVIMREMVLRTDWGTAASGDLQRIPYKTSYSPPLLVLPQRIFFGMATAGLASLRTGMMRMHYRLVGITSDQQLREILETFQLST